MYYFLVIVELKFLTKMEREKGIEPSYQAWKACVLPLNYSRGMREFCQYPV